MKYKRASGKDNAVGDFKLAWWQLALKEKGGAEGDVVVNWRKAVCSACVCLCVPVCLKTCLQVCYS